jgi:hypothetical protein
VNVISSNTLIPYVTEAEITGQPAEIQPAARYSGAPLWLAALWRRLSVKNALACLILR